MDILYSDKDIIACIKPVGMDAEHEVPEALQAEFGGEIFTVHRLDLNVGGVMVYARNKQSAAALSKAVQEGTMVKEYIAMVHGVVPEEGDWEDLLWKDGKKNKVFVVNRMRGGVKKARLEYKRLLVQEWDAESTSLVRIRLHTGRSHQIRVQFASRGLSLVGERKYAERNDPCEIALFSSCLAFTHPSTGEKLHFTLQPPEVFPWTQV